MADVRLPLVEKVREQLEDNAERLFYVFGARLGEEQQYNFLLLDARWTGETSGKLVVPHAYLDIFYEAYAKMAAVKMARSQLSIVERRDPVFRMFFDIDMTTSASQAELWSQDSRVLEVAAMVMVTVKRFYEGGMPCAENAFDTSQLLAAMTCMLSFPDKPRAKPGTDKLKWGLHIHFPRLYVTSDMALQMHGAVASDLQKRWPVEEGQPLWLQIVDPCVYVDAGLRMVFSCKVLEHRVPDPTSVYEPRYRVWFQGGSAGGKLAADILEEDGQIDAKWCHRMVSMFSIRAPSRRVRDFDVTVCDFDTEAAMEGEDVLADSPEEGMNLVRIFRRFRVPLNCPQPMQLATSNGDRRKRKRRAPTDPAAGRGQALARNDGNLIRMHLGPETARDSTEVRDRSLLELICLTIQSRPGWSEYRDIEIKSVRKRRGTRPTYQVLVWGTGSRYCMLRADAHLSNHIFFLMTPQGISQRCHDEDCKVAPDTCDSRQSYGEYTQRVHAELFGMGASGTNAGFLRFTSGGALMAVQLAKQARHKEPTGIVTLALFHDAHEFVQRLSTCPQQP